MPETSGCQGKKTSRGDVVVQKDFKEVLGKLSGMLASLRCWWNYKEKTLFKKKKTSISKAFQTTDKVAYGIMHRPNFSSKASKTCSRTIVSKTSTEPNQIQNDVSNHLRSIPTKCWKYFLMNSWNSDVKSCSENSPGFFKDKGGIQDVEWTISLDISSFLAPPPMPPPPKKNSSQ